MNTIFVLYHRYGRIVIAIEMSHRMMVDYQVGLNLNPTKKQKNYKNNTIDRNKNVKFAIDYQLHTFDIFCSPYDTIRNVPIGAFIDWY